MTQSWIGILAEGVRCVEPSAKEVCAQMENGTTIVSEGIPLVAIRMHNRLVAYGRVIQSLPEKDGSAVRHHQRMMDRAIAGVERAMSRLGISGTVIMMSIEIKEGTTTS